MKNEKQATDPTSPRYAMSGFHNKRAETEECLLKVYPNPSEGTAIVEGSGKLMVVNALGQLVLSRDVDGQTTLTLPSGLYFVRMESERGISVNKLVVK